MKLLRYLGMLLLSSVALLNAQETVIEKQKTFNPHFERKFKNLKIEDVRKFGEMIENDSLIGYYFVNSIENETKTFLLELFDNELKIINKIEIEKDKKAEIVEVLYNGNAFLLVFKIKKGINLVTFDKKGIKLGEFDYKKVKVHLNNDYYFATGAFDYYKTNLFYKMGENGFYVISYNKNYSTRYKIKAFDNNLVEQWTDSANKNKKLVMANPLISSSEYFGFIRNKINANFVLRASSEFVLLSGKNGDELFALPFDDENNLKIETCFINEKKEEVVLTGEYFKLKNNPNENKSEGVFLMKLNLSGKILNLEKIEWKDSKIFKMDSSINKKDQENYFSIQNVFIDNNGDYFLQAEQLNIGMSMNINASPFNKSPYESVDYTLKDLIVFKLDSTFKLIKTSLINKNKENKSGSLTSALILTPLLVSRMLKNFNKFDYLYTKFNKSKNTFTAYHFDLNQTNKKDKNFISYVYAITYKDGKIIEKKRSADNAIKKHTFLKQAKDGYVLVGLYDNKKDELKIELVPVDQTVL